jgi:hypothetical protein
VKKTGIWQIRKASKTSFGEDKGGGRKFHTQRNKNEDRSAPKYLVSFRSSASTMEHWGLECLREFSC